jgi:hypothetical protein
VFRAGLIGPNRSLSLVLVVVLNTSVGPALCVPTSFLSRFPG